MAKEKDNRRWASAKRKILATCPSCDEDHIAYVNYTGHGKPKLYCVKCRVKWRYHSQGVAAMG